jgi:hypothetical protein
MDTQKLITLFIVGIAALYLGRNFLRAGRDLLRGKSDCGSGCGKCGAPATRPDHARRPNVIPLSERKR